MKESGYAPDHLLELQPLSGGSFSVFRLHTNTHTHKVVHHYTLEPYTIWGKGTPLTIVKCSSIADGAVQMAKRSKQDFLRELMKYNPYVVFSSAGSWRAWAPCLRPVLFWSGASAGDRDMGLFLRASSTLSTSDDLVHSTTERDARAVPPQAQHAAEHRVKINKYHFNKMSGQACRQQRGGFIYVWKGRPNRKCS